MGGRLVGVAVGSSVGVLVGCGVVVEVGTAGDEPPNGDRQATRKKASSMRGIQFLCTLFLFVFVIASRPARASPCQPARMVCRRHS